MCVFVCFIFCTSAFHANKRVHYQTHLYASNGVLGVTFGSQNSRSCPESGRAKRHFYHYGSIFCGTCAESAKFSPSTVYHPATSCLQDRPPGFVELTSRGKQDIAFNIHAFSDFSQRRENELTHPAQFRTWRNYHVLESRDISCCTRRKVWPCTVCLFCSLLSWRITYILHLLTCALGTFTQILIFLCSYRAMHVVLARYCYRKSSVRPSVCPSVRL